MRNAWKGLVVGGLTGVVAGVILESLSGAAKKASDVGDQVREHAPDAGRWVQSVADKAGDWLHDADVAEHVRTAAHKLTESDTADRVTEAGHNIAAGVRQAKASHSA